LPPEQFTQAMNEATVVKILIESPLGIENIEAIAALPGVDLVGIGTNDLSAELGVPGQHAHPRVRQAHDAALGACRRANKPLAIGGIPELAYNAELIRCGAVPFLFTGIDTDILLGAARDRVAQALASLKSPSL
jgi:2-keto-3-deoxy-L-rhamnonate aldolase RhmA